METKLITDITVADICQGFEFDKHEGKGLLGLGGKLTIQPEYQRNYLYSAGRGEKEEAVIQSLLKGHPLGVLYFNTLPDGRLEVLDGQQRITSLGRFRTELFPVRHDGHEKRYGSLPQDPRVKIDQSRLLIYECTGAESEIKEWFKTINIAGIPLNKQEERNAVYSGPFVTLAKAEFSNRLNSNVQMWGAYIEGSVIRQEFLERALDWVSHGDIDGYMSAHRHDDSINELKTHFSAVINWVAAVFPGPPHPGMCGLKWGALYDRYHTTTYDPAAVAAEVERLDGDPQVTNKRGIFEYILGGKRKRLRKLLNVRVFDEPTRRAAYARQKQAAEASGESNCPHCVIEAGVNNSRIYPFKEMEADHFSAWSRGGESTAENCRMLCITHNRLKGNR